jgi:protease-4
MTLETETVIDRRRMRRHVTFWRAVAVAGLALAFGAFAFTGDRIPGLPGSHEIARVTVEGTILESRPQLKLLKKLAEDDSVDAVLVFVNSPGGTTTGGEALYDGLRGLAKKKPVVAQFGTLAASAGYIVGLGTDHIVSRGNTITGSVGVIMQWPEVSELLGKIGVKMNEIKSGSLKAAPSPFQPMDEAARDVTQRMVGEGFAWFLSLVEERRGVRPADVPGLEQGRIFSGREALKHKLVDEIGGEAEAVKYLEEKRGIRKGLRVVDWKPKRESGWSFLWSMASWTGLLGDSEGPLSAMLQQDRTLSTLSLDGLVSVWHPAEK